MNKKPRVRNYIARNRKNSGSGRHKNKKREHLMGSLKHRKELFTVE